MRPRTIAIIQARMGSSRLPDKVLLDIGGQPMLARVVNRARRASGVDEVVVATTTAPEDEAVAGFCDQRGFPSVRGSLHDVLDRYYQAARQFQAQVVVRLTADCPLLDPLLVDDTLGALYGRTPQTPGAYLVPQSAIRNQQSEFLFDFAANRLPPPWPRTFPIGLDVEVCTFAALERAWGEASQQHEREHVLPYLYEEPGRFRVVVMDHKPDYGHLRWTVDTLADLELARQVYARFDGRDDFSWQDVLALFEREPDLAQINAQVPHKTYRDVDRRQNEKA